ncbi:MAG: extracellular solute-binding protein [Rhizobiales bacterium]|nr:extracellular solute-binding protein [Hyphomicrobiales bacterium]
MQHDYPEWRLPVAALTALGIAVAGPAFAQDTAVIDKIAVYKGADREKLLVEGAKKEGTVTFYSSLTVDQALRPIVAGFQAKYPFMNPRYVRDDPPQMLQKLMAEARANNMVADVFENTGLEVPARRAGIVRPFWSPEVEAYPKEHRSPDNYWAATRFSYLGACYNTNLVKPNEAPRTFEDLLNPKWKGKIAWSSTVIGSILFITGVRNFMGEQKAMEYLTQLSKQDIAPIASTNRAVVDRIIAGEYALCLDSFLHHPIISAKKGAPVAPKPMDPVMTLSSSVMLPKAPPHPYAAMLFIDYLISVDGQKRFQAADYFPAHPKVPAKDDLNVIVPSKIGLKSNVITPEMMANELPKSRAIYQQLFVK